MATEFETLQGFRKRAISTWVEIEQLRRDVQSWNDNHDESDHVEEERDLLPTAKSLRDFVYQIDHRLRALSGVTGHRMMS